MPRRKALRPAKLKRTLADIRMGADVTHLIGTLESFLVSDTWKVIQGILAEEAFTQEAALRTFVRKSDLHCEAAYACGSTEAFEHVSNEMIRQFIETLKTGKSAGVLESDKPDDEDEKLASGSVTTREEN